MPRGGGGCGSGGGYPPSLASNVFSLPLDSAKGLETAEAIADKSNTTTKNFRENLPKLLMAKSPYNVYLVYGWMIHPLHLVCIPAMMSNGILARISLAFICVETPWWEPSLKNF